MERHTEARHRSFGGWPGETLSLSTRGVEGQFKKERGHSSVFSRLRRILLYFRKKTEKTELRPLSFPFSFPFPRRPRAGSCTREGPRRKVFGLESTPLGSYHYQCTLILLLFGK
jgi:hypothetical protein